MKLIDTPADIGIDEAAVAEFRTNPAAVLEVHEDVLRDMMSCPHPIERARLTERADAEHPRRRTCV